MNDDSKKAQESLVHFRKQEMAKRSDRLVKRGIAQLHRRECRVIKFPPRYSIGTLYIVNSNDSGFWWDQEWEELDEAMGKVLVPFGKKVILEVCERDEIHEVWAGDCDDYEVESFTHLLPLSELKSDDLHGIDLSRVSLSCLEIGESWASIEYLHSLTSLEWISLQGNKIGDEELAFLSEMDSLEYLNLSNTEVCGSALYQLKNSKLRELRLSATYVGDLNGLGFLHYLPYLERLNLGGNEVTYSSLSDISTLINLRELVIDFDNWNNFELKELDDALPSGCEIIQW